MWRIFISVNAEHEIELDHDQRNFWFDSKLLSLEQNFILNMQINLSCILFEEKTQFLKLHLLKKILFLMQIMSKDLYLSHKHILYNMS